MTTERKKYFWDNWSFKDSLYYATVLICGIVGYIRLESRVEYNKIMSDQKQEMMMKQLDEDKVSMSAKLNEIKTEIKELRNIFINESINK
ncbi:MAG: hypothetical protein HGGPFJEG_03061 [Ignavibacteria bacterium]|nr:hypothetical protein [Ignavibacteria bacterium]